MRGAALLKRAEIARLQGFCQAQVNPRPAQATSHTTARMPA
jgi:hypothetical protein